MEQTTSQVSKNADLISLEELIWKVVIFKSLKSSIDFEGERPIYDCTYARDVVNFYIKNDVSVLEKIARETESRLRTWLDKEKSSTNFIEDNNEILKSIYIGGFIIGGIGLFSYGLLKSQGINIQNFATFSLISIAVGVVCACLKAHNDDVKNISNDEIKKYERLINETNTQKIKGILTSDNFKEYAVKLIRSLEKPLPLEYA